MSPDGMPPAPPAGAVTGAVRGLLRAEGAALAIAALLLFHGLGGSWSLFAVLLLAPDLSFCGYLVSPRVGALAYNAAHVTLGPAALGLIALLWREPLAAQLAAIWLAHIGIDRAIGYGLKYPAGFGITHLGLIGPAARQKT
jgi:hypothetical protein